MKLKLINLNLGLTKWTNWRVLFFNLSKPMVSLARCEHNSAPVSSRQLTTRTKLSKREALSTGRTPLPRNCAKTPTLLCAPNWSKSSWSFTALSTPWLFLAPKLTLKAKLKIETFSPRRSASMRRQTSHSWCHCSTLSRPNPKLTRSRHSTSPASLSSSSSKTQLIWQLRNLHPSSNSPLQLTSISQRLQTCSRNFLARKSQDLTGTKKSQTPPVRQQGKSQTKAARTSLTTTRTTLMTTLRRSYPSTTITSSEKILTLESALADRVSR